VTVDLPHDAMLLEKRDGGCRNGVNSGYFPGGKYAYGKTFELDAAMLGKSVALHFEGVYQNCKVYVNGKLAGSHRYGYTAFDVNISDFVESGENNIRVEVDNSLEPNCRWYSGSGIYRPVHLLIREQNHISQVHMETVQIQPAKVRVDVKTTQDSDITVDIYEGEETSSQRKAWHFGGAGGQAVECRKTLSLHDPGQNGYGRAGDCLWHPQAGMER